MKISMTLKLTRNAGFDRCLNSVFACKYLFALNISMNSIIEFQ